MPVSLQGAVVGAKESGMPDPTSHRGQAAAGARGAGRPLTVVELSVVLEELDRVVAELEASLAEIALPLDEPSRCAARAAIAVASRR
jgi:hypothetical protein